MIQVSALFLIASECLGVPYIYGGNNPSEGMDCSGLVNYILKKTNYFPQDMQDMSSHMLYEHFKSKVGITSQAPRHGNLLFFGTPEKISHISIAIDDSWMIEAYGPGKICNSVEVAKKHDARVMFNRINRRGDLVASFNIGV